jgi:hypothetical protein
MQVSMTLAHLWEMSTAPEDHGALNVANQLEGDDGDRYMVRGGHYNVLMFHPVVSDRAVAVDGDHEQYA